MRNRPQWAQQETPQVGVLALQAGEHVDHPDVPTAAAGTQGPHVADAVHEASDTCMQVAGVAQGLVGW